MSFVPPPLNYEIKQASSTPSLRSSQTLTSTEKLQGKQVTLKRSAEIAFGPYEYLVKIEKLFEEASIALSYNPKLSKQEVREKTKTHLILPLETLVSQYPYSDCLYMSVSSHLNRLYDLKLKKRINLSKINSNNLLIRAAYINYLISARYPNEKDSELNFFIHLFWQRNWETICEIASTDPEIKKKPDLIERWIAAELLQQELKWGQMDEIEIQCALMELKSFTHANASEAQLNQFIRGLRRLFPQNFDKNFFEGSNLDLAFQSVMAHYGIWFKDFTRTDLLPMRLRLMLQSLNNTLKKQNPPAFQERAEQSAVTVQVQASYRSLVVDQWLIAFMPTHEKTLLTPECNQLRSASKITADSIIHPTKPLATYQQDVTHFCSLACDLFFNTTGYPEKERIRFFRAFFGYLLQQAIGRQNYFLAKACLKSTLEKLKGTPFFDKSPRAQLFMNKKYRELVASCEKEDDTSSLSLELYIISREILKEGLPELNKIFPSILTEFQDRYLKRMLNQRFIEKSTYKKTYPLLRTFLVFGYKKTIPNTLDPLLYPYFLDILEKLPQ